MSSWHVSKVSKKNIIFKNPLLIGGLPGIGNVGKVAVDFIINEVDAEKIYEFSSYSLPHSVFVNEDNLIDLPVISLFYKKVKGRDILFLSGDAQPVDEVSSYEFSDKVISLLMEYKLSEIITLGGIGLPNVPKHPRIFCTGTSKEIVKSYASTEGIKVETALYGVVGPIVGVSGVLLGLAKRKNIRGVALLAETYAHPLYLGIKGAREIVFILNKRFGLGINIKDLDKEIADMEREEDSEVPSKVNPLRKIKNQLGNDATYIG